MAESTGKPPRGGARRAVWRRIPSGIWALGFVSLLMDVSSEMIHALLPAFLVVGLGASALTVGLIEGVAQATAAITKVFSGALSDMLGRRKALAAVGYGLAAVTKPVFAMAGSVGWVAGARFVDRIGKGIRGAPRDALVADIAPPDIRGAAIGLRQSLDTAGAFIGPLLGVALMWYFANDFQAVFWVSLLPAVVAVGLILFLVHEPPRPAGRRKVRAPLSRAEMARLGTRYWWVVALAAVFTLARFSEAFLVLRAQAMGLPLALLPFVFVLMNLTHALTAYPVGALSDRIGRVGLLTTGLGVLVLADLLLAGSATLWGIGLGVVLWGLHLGLSEGLFRALVADTVPEELRGTGYGVFNLVTGLALLLASVIAGAFWEILGPSATFAGGAAFAAIALLGLLTLRGRLAGPAV